MATIKKGILGGFSGKVGTVVGSNWRGKDIIRSLPKESQKQPSEKQLLQQAKFKLAVAFLQPLKTILSQYFGSGSGVKSRVNLATSYTMNEATQVVADVPELMYNKVLITKGELTGFQNAVLGTQGRRYPRPGMGRQQCAGQCLAIRPGECGKLLQGTERFSNLRRYRGALRPDGQCHAPELLHRENDRGLDLPQHREADLCE